VEECEWKKTAKDVEASSYGLFSATNPAFSLTDWTECWLNIKPRTF